ncbi:class II fructose-bisphosphate aldolase [Rickettsiales bacterium LUAb2]
MALVPLRLLLDHAAENNYGHPAFNVTNMEQIHAVFKAARQANSPVVIQYSSSARKYATDNFIKQFIKAIEAEYSEIPFAVHQDHGGSFKICLSAIQTGFSSVMIDGSLLEDHKTPSSYEYNINISKKVAEAAHAVGVSVEAELGVLGSLETGMGDKEDGHGFDGVLSKDKLLTDPKQAADFVKQTGVDSLAVAIGTSHGAYKFTRKPTGDILDIDRIAEISKATGGTHLVMHGSSSVPQKYQDMINEFGGNIKQTYGVPIEEIQRGIKNGVRKVNIDTDLRMAFIGAVRKVLHDKADTIDHRTVLNEGTNAIYDVCLERYMQFGCEGMASKIKVQTLADFAKNYYK